MNDAKMVLADGTPWPILVCLGISDAQQRVLETG